MPALLTLSLFSVTLGTAFGVGLSLGDLEGKPIVFVKTFESEINAPADGFRDALGVYTQRSKKPPHFWQIGVAHPTLGG